MRRKHQQVSGAVPVNKLLRRQGTQQLTPIHSKILFLQRPATGEMKTKIQFAVRKQSASRQQIAHALVFDKVPDKENLQSSGKGQAQARLSSVTRQEFISHTHLDNLEVTGRRTIDRRYRLPQVLADSENTGSFPKSEARGQPQTGRPGSVPVQIRAMSKEDLRPLEKKR